MKRVSPTGRRGCEAADGRSDRRNGAYRAPAGAANPHAAPPAAISALPVAVGRGALRDSADGRDLDDINAQFRRWRDCVARQRRHPDQPDHTIADVWAQEKPACCPCRRIPSRPNSSAPSAPGRPPTSASTVTPTRFPTPTSGSRSRSWPAPPASASSTGRPSSPAIDVASYDTGQTIEDPERLEGLLAATRQANAHTTRDRLRVAAPPPPRSSTASPNVASRYARTPPGSSPSSTTTGRRNSPPLSSDTRN